MRRIPCRSFSRRALAAMRSIPCPGVSSMNTLALRRTPPASIRGDYRSLPPVVPSGSSHNPMGAAAMTLSGGGEYAIHGTNAPGTIGGFVSHGCIRMFNEDIMDLYSRTSIGTRVVVTR